MSRNAFSDCEQEYNRRIEQGEIAKAERLSAKEKQMELVRIDVLDGSGVIPVAVSGQMEAIRLLAFIREAHKAIDDAAKRVELVTASTFIELKKE